MSKLDATLARLRENEGVQQLILLGRDGLVVTQSGEHRPEDEPIAARVPGLALACDALGKAAGRGSFMTAVLEFEGGVIIVLSLSNELLLGVLVRPLVGFAPLLRELRTERERLIGLL